MSITFQCPSAPTQMVALDPDEPTQLEAQSVLPVINLGQDTALALLRLMHLPAKAEGEVADEELSAATRRLLLTVNSAKTRMLEFIPPSDTDGNGPRMVSAGMAEDRLKRYASKLLELFTQAQQQNYAVVWS